MSKLFFTFGCLLLGIKSFAFSELTAEFGYGRHVYGTHDQNTELSRTYSGSLAQYFFETTALEFNYSYDSEVTTENDTVSISGTGYSIVSMQNTVNTTVYGIGLKQALAGRKAFIRPVFSFGYAKQFLESWTDYTFQNDTTKSRFTTKQGPYKGRSDSAFAAFSLQLKMTETFSLEGTIKTVFPAFKTGLAKNNIKYTAGFTWFF